MGSLTCFGTPHRIQFDDRLLTHVQVVTIQKFRRGEAFSMSWIKSTELGGGRASAWLVPTAPLYFEFHGSRVPTINSVWLARLRESADSGRGLIITNEDGTLAREVAVAGADRRTAWAS